jgi:transcriptional regulator with XRE-family HTH domain
MITFEDVWGKLSKSKKYREHYALALLKRSVPFQIKTLRKKYFGSQADLAEASGITQGVVSRAENQDYGNLTLNSIGRIAGGLDVAFVGKFVPFSQLVKFSLNLSEEEFANIPTFEEENAGLGPVAHLAELLPFRQLGSVENASPDTHVLSRMPPRSATDSDGNQSVQDEREISGGGAFGYDTGGAAALGAAARAY